MNINNKYFERAKQIVESNSTLISKNLKNLDYDKTRFGTVISYDIITNLATVLLDGDDTEIPNLPNLSGSYLKADDTVLVNKIRGSLSNAYIDKNVTAPNRQQDWIEPTLLNGWVNFGSSFYNAGYMRDAMGYVHLRGTINSGTGSVGTVLFNLPTGYRPTKPVALVVCMSRSGANSVGRIDVDSNGNVSISIATDSYIHLNSYTFKAEQ